MISDEVLEKRVNFWVTVYTKIGLPTLVTIVLGYVIWWMASHLLIPALNKQSTLVDKLSVAVDTWSEQAVKTTESLMEITKKLNDIKIKLGG